MTTSDMDLHDDSWFSCTSTLLILFCSLIFLLFPFSLLFNVTSFEMFLFRTQCPFEESSISFITLPLYFYFYFMVSFFPFHSYLRIVMRVTRRTAISRRVFIAKMCRVCGADTGGHSYISISPVILIGWPCFYVPVHVPWAFF